jgi:hypothetical protein
MKAFDQARSSLQACWAGETLHREMLNAVDVRIGKQNALPYQATY